jgi:hypothetical protein
MKPNRLAILAIACLALAAPAWSSEGKKEAVVPVGPPQPRVLEPMRSRPLPPRAADPSWLLYSEGMRLFGERRLGEALLSFKKAVDARAELFDRASKDIAAALATKEAARAKDSLSLLVDLLASRDLIPQEFEAIHEKAGGSMIAEMGLLRERSPSSPLRGFIDAALLVMETRGLSRVGNSLAALKKAATDLASYPEAEFSMGKVYLAEGEARLAELQMLRAYGMRESLEVADDRFAMLEAIAGIYRTQGNLKDYELRLREIADASDLFSGKDEHYRNAMERTLANQGFDRFMTLYRVGESFAVGAYSALGSLYKDSGRPLAVIYLAAAVNSVLTRVIAEIRVDEPGYAYKGLPELLARIAANGDLSLYAGGSGLWRDMVLLGEALAEAGSRDTARELWSAVAATPGAGDPWGRRAASDLSSWRNASRRPSP